MSLNQKQSVNITPSFIKKWDPCKPGLDWYLEKFPKKFNNSIGVLDALIKANQLPYANWLIVRVMSRPQYLKYAIYAAEQVIGIYEKKYPNNPAPRNAIKAAKAVLKNDTIENRKAAAAAAYAAYAAAAAYAAYAAAAAYAAYAAAADAAYAAYAADAAYAAYAAYAAAAAYADARKEMRLKILRYGIKLLKAGE